MNFLFNACGANTPLIKEYEIAKDTEIKAGEAVAINDSLVVKADDGDIILGVSAEDHSGKEDILNVRSNGEKIRVNIACGTIYEASAPVYTVLAGSSSNSLVVSSAGLSANIKSGRAVLISKAENSANEAALYSERRITACSVSGANATLTVEDGETASEGDVYMIIPDIGDEVYLNFAGTGISLYNSASTVKLICACADKTTGKLGVFFKAPLI